MRRYLLGLFLLSAVVIHPSAWASLDPTGEGTPTLGLRSSIYKANTNSLPEPPNSGSSITITKKYFKVDAGSSFVCGIRQKDRGLDCWGLNDLGQLNAPKKGKYKKLSLGEMHGCAIRLDNRLVCWGDPGSTPKDEDLKGRYLDVSSGDSHTCAIQKKGGSIQCWGSNLQGQLTPPQGRFKSISARNNQTCAVSTKGQVLCWGEDAFESFIQPMGVFTDVTVGKLHACAVRQSDNGVQCWGNNFFGVLNPPGGEKFLEVLSGDYHSCGVTLDKRLVCWGRDQWGQVSGIPPVATRSVGAGGELTCLVDTKRQILCKGSYDYSGPRGNGVQNFTQAAAGEDAKSKSGGIWGFIGGLAAKGAGYGLKAWGESMETGSGGQKFVLFAAGLLGAKPDANKQRFEAIQIQLKDVQQQLTQIEKQLDDTYIAVQALSCQTALTQFTQYRQTVDSAHEAYQRLVSRVLLDLTRQQQGLGPDPTTPGQIQAFMDQWDEPVQSALRDVLRDTHRFLVSNESPLITCMNAGLEKWRQTAQHPFDDRNLYEGTYLLQETSEMMQLQASIILQDISARRVVNALRDQVFDRQPNAPAIDASLVPETGLCGEAHRHVAAFPKDQIPLAQARWVYAEEYCNDANTIIKDTYKRLIQQIEFAGAPYTSDAVVASLSGKVFGHGESTKNWLWINLSKVDPSEISFTHSQYIGGFPLNGGIGKGWHTIVFRNGGEANWYSHNRNGAGLWLGASQAWKDLYSSYDAYLKDNNKKDDLLDMMGRIESPYVNEEGTQSMVKLLPKITDTPFWMSNEKYDLQWNRIAGDDRTDLITKDVRCFVAAGINPTWYYSSGGSGNPHETLRLTGKVCGSEEFAGMARQGKAVSKDGKSAECTGGQTCYLWGNGRGYEFDPRGGYGLPELSEYPGGDAFFDKYSSSLGKYVFFIWWHGNSLLFENAVFFRDGALMHYPVVDLSMRSCEPSLVVQGVAGDPVVDRHLNTLTRGNGLEIPTRCGKDMDKFIEDRVPRPTYPVIPENEVRPAVY